MEVRPGPERSRPAREREADGLASRIRTSGRQEQGVSGISPPVPFPQSPGCQRQWLLNLFGFGNHDLYSPSLPVRCSRCLEGTHEGRGMGWPDGYPEVVDVRRTDQGGTDQGDGRLLVMEGTVTASDR